MDIRSAVPDILLAATMGFDQETDKLVKPREVRVNQYITYLEIFLNELEQEESKKKASATLSFRRSCRPHAAIYGRRQVLIPH